MNKKVLLFIAAQVCCLAVTGQSRHEFSFYGGGGLSTLNYDLTKGEQKNGFGGLAGVGYTFFFSDKFGLGTGAEAALYNAKTTLGNFSERYSTSDYAGANFEFRSTVTNYEEKQHAWMVNIPLMLQFQTSGKHRFYLAAGGKAGIPVSSKYKVDGSTFTNSGYYAYEDYEYKTQEFMGFGNFTARNTDKDLDFKVAYMGSAEAGMKWKLKDGLSLYTGIYFDYGFNDIQKDDRNKKLIEYQTTSNGGNFVNNSVLVSQHTENNNTTSFTDKVAPMAIGLKVKLAFGKGSTAKKVEEPVVIPIIVDSSDEDRLRAEEEARRKAAEAERLRLEEEARRKAAEAERLKETAYREMVTLVEETLDGYPINVTTLDDRKERILDKKIALLKEYPDVEVVCEGHTCDIGSESTNVKVGLKRAENVKKYMMANGISESRITITSKGEAEPVVVPNDSEANRRLNRRVIFEVK